MAQSLPGGTGSAGIPNRGDRICIKEDFTRRIRIKEGVFAGLEGVVQKVIEAKRLVKVEVTIFGRPVPLELEYGQVEML